LVILNFTAKPGVLSVLPSSREGRNDGVLACRLLTQRPFQGIIMFEGWQRKASFGLREGSIMNRGNDRPLWQSKWNILVIYVALIVVFVATTFLVFFTNVFGRSADGRIPQLVWLAAALVFLVAVILILSRTIQILEALQETNVKLERIIEAFERSRFVLSQIDQGVRLGETAKAIAFRDANSRLLRETVLDKFEHQDFEAVDRMIDEIAHCPAYAELAEQLRQELNKHLDTADLERMKQDAAHIEKLFESYQWAEASVQIERLIKAYPRSEEAKALRQKLISKKEERKRILLTVWDDAVQRQATDRSLEILKELDMYLTPNEGLGLQEAARDVFKTKLHNLGVQFSLAASGKNWARALEIGQQIMRDFPNSKIAEEIREKADFLKEKLKQQSA